MGCSQEMQAKLEERRRKVEGLPPVFSADEAPSPSDEPKPAEPAPPLLAAVPTVKSEPEAGGRRRSFKDVRVDQLRFLLNLIII